MYFSLKATYIIYITLHIHLSDFSKLYTYIVPLKLKACTKVNPFQTFHQRKCHLNEKFIQLLYIRVFLRAISLSRVAKFSHKEN